MQQQPWTQQIYIELLQVVTTSAQTHAQNSEITNQFREQVKQLKQELKFNTAARNITSEPVKTSTGLCFSSRALFLFLRISAGFSTRIVCGSQPLLNLCFADFSS
jgi:hypothetical protein